MVITDGMKKREVMDQLRDLFLYLINNWERQHKKLSVMQRH